MSFSELGMNGLLGGGLGMANTFTGRNTFSSLSQLSQYGWATIGSRDKPSAPKKSARPIEELQEEVDGWLASVTK